MKKGEIEKEKSWEESGARCSSHANDTVYFTDPDNTQNEECQKFVIDELDQEE